MAKDDGEHTYGYKDISHSWAMDRSIAILPRPRGGDWLVDSSQQRRVMPPLGGVLSLPPRHAMAYTAGMQRY